jgi:hypothetical protein
MSSNTVTNQLIVNPGLPGPLTNQPFQIMKKPNASTSLANSMIFFTYANTGPIQRIVVLSGGNNYTGNTTLTGIANTRVRNLGILGKMRIVEKGYDYVVGDEIEIINRPWEIGQAETVGIGARGYVAAVNATGAITSVKFKEVPGYYVGGSGYNMNRLPTANIISATGIGGNVIVTAVLGDGEQLNTVTDDIGSILKLDIISGGSGYASAPIINLKSIGSGTAQAVATVVQGVFTYPGRYLNDDGHLSSFNFLQDGRYYHNYSYVVRVKESIANYRKALKELAHPAGMSLFGEYTSVDNGKTMNIQVRTERQTNQIMFKFATYDANSGNISIFRTEHGLESGNTVYLEFQSGNTINIMNGIFTVATSNANTFFVVQSNTVNTSGNVYYGIIQ